MKQIWTVCASAALLLTVLSILQASAQNGSVSSAPDSPSAQPALPGVPPAAISANSPDRPSGAPKTCDAYLPAGFVFPPSAGTTLVSYHLGMTGQLSDASLYRSSGNSDLDQAALACVSGTRWSSALAAVRPADVTLIGGVRWGSRFHSFTNPSPTGVPNHCNKYPPLSARLDQEGTTVLDVHITAEGSVENPKLTQSSGYTALDQTALECVAAFRYFPAVQNGHPVATDRTMKFDWRLARTPLGPVVKFAVDDDGSVLLEGQRFSDPGALRAKLAEINSRNPRPGLCELPAPAFNWHVLRVMSRSGALLKAAGVPSIRFCTVPFADMNRKAE